MLISSALLVQPDEGVSDLVVDRIGVNYRNLPRRVGFLKHRLEPGTSASEIGNSKLLNRAPAAAVCGGDPPSSARYGARDTIVRWPCDGQLAVGPQPLWLRNHNSGLVHRIMYGPFNPYIPIRSTTIGKSRVAIDPIAMHTSWRSNSDIASVTSIGYPRMSASGESSTTMHRLLHASGSHPIPTPYDPKFCFLLKSAVAFQLRVFVALQILGQMSYLSNTSLLSRFPLFTNS
ncbi:bifunctional 3-dehydroquinate dehydratase/shikimate dehydrogenase, chloroplastic-like [Dorcoceras hygrometricum]|uniref:Bifunctional 3-dehydroquinate dehydratase/shikimate dehydrogenase, chloroplastic-like n=1 Tax=Dorcoceras hygrometricum TaxID=472368 RepID=A0A2Z7B9W8_9LAMI|nr:bifunctional 3-dehydroquinate dehydratase/shikimate dehydrogenase, chloroplastic-like [Dorcoceras hygrometricum]